MLCILVFDCFLSCLFVFQSLFVFYLKMQLSPYKRFISMFICMSVSFSTREKLSFLNLETDLYCNICSSNLPPTLTLIGSSLGLHRRWWPTIS